MPIVITRIDDRLIHGQIVQGWLKAVEVDKIIVVSDDAAADAMQRILMAMAVPPGVEFEVMSVKEASQSVLNGDCAKPKTMLLAANPADVLFIIEQGADIKSVNAGGMHFVSGKRQILCNISVDDADVENLYKIYEKGVEIEGRVLPQDERVDIIPMIEREYRACKEKDNNAGE